MKGLSTLAAVALLAASAAGCVSKANSAPGREAPLGYLSTTGTYDVLSQTEGTSSGAILLWFIPIGFEDKSGSWGTPESTSSNPLLWPFELLGGLFGGWNAEERVRNAAFYNAIEAQRDADALVAPRWEVETTNYVLFKQIKARVKGKAIRYNATGAAVPAATPAPK